MKVKHGYKLTLMGLIPEDWYCTPLRQIASSSRNAIVGGPFGSDLMSKDYVEHGVPVIRGQNMGGKWVCGNFAFVTHAKAKSLEANLAHTGDIVFTQRGTLGQVSMVPDSSFECYLISQSQMKVTLDREVVSPLFLYYVFSGEEKQELIRKATIQTGVPHINLSILREMRIQVPPLPEQRAIAACLSTWDKAIAATTELIAQKEQQKKWLMQQLLTGRKRLKGFKGQWKEAKLGDITRKISSRNTDSIDARVYSVTNNNGFVLQSDHFKREIAGDDRTSYKVIRKNEFAYNPARINVGSIAYFEDEIGIISSLYVCFETTNEILDYYLEQLFRLYYVKHKINILGEGGVRIYLWYELFAKIRISLPGMEEQKAIAHVLETATEEISVLQALLINLQDQKKGLMQQLLMGKKRIKE